MKLPVTALHYSSLSNFKKEFYKNLLTHEHLVDEHIKIDKMTTPDGGINENFDFWGYVLAKDGKKYLVSSKGKDGSDVNVRKMLPIDPRHTEKLAAKGTVYYLVRKPIEMRFRPEQHLSFKECVDTLTQFDHTNKEHQTLYAILSIASLIDRCNFRITTPPGFGKDSNVDILGNIFGGCGTIENPTIAKLEERAQALGWLAVNEVVDISTTKWREIEQFLLATGAFKPEVTKRSRAYKGLGETIDVSTLSISLLYNDIDHYTDPTSYFDFVTKAAVKDRFLPLRFSGRLCHNFEDPNITPMVYKDQYKMFIETLTSFKQKGVGTSMFKLNVSLDVYPSRWKTNLSILLNYVSAYCSSQEEYDTLCKLLVKCIQDYKDMLSYPKVLQKFAEKCGIQKNDLKDCTKVVAIKHLLKNRDHAGYLDQVERASSYTDRLLLLREFRPQRHKFDITAGGEQQFF